MERQGSHAPRRQRRVIELMKTVAIGALVVAGTMWVRAEAQSRPAAASGDLVARGEYLVNVGACAACHTPAKMGPNGPEPDMSRFLSGHPASVVVKPAPQLVGSWVWASTATHTAFAGPWGISYASNLTPDETGLGPVSESVFIQAMKTGRHLGVGRPILPPMPWPLYSQMTDEDLKAIYAYLRTLKPVRNQVPDPEPPAPGSAGHH